MTYGQAYTSVQALHWVKQIAAAVDHMHTATPQVRTFGQKVPRQKCKFPLSTGKSMSLDKAGISNASKLSPQSLQLVLNSDVDKCFPL